MREHKYPLVDLDNLQFRMSCATELVGTVQEAMAGESSSTEETHSNALYGAYRHLADLVDEMREITDVLFAERKEAAKRPVAKKEEGTT
ncbi:MAG: hypothetical protein RSD46_01285 [Oscillospiraceae bacterium]